MRDTMPWERVCSTSPRSLSPFASSPFGTSLRCEIRKMVEWIRLKMCGSWLEVFHFICLNKLSTQPILNEIPFPFALSFSRRRCSMVLSRRPSHTKLTAWSSNRPGKRTSTWAADAPTFSNGSRPLSIQSISSFKSYALRDPAVCLKPKVDFLVFWIQVEWDQSVIVCGGGGGVNCRK